jgi:glycosidase
MTDSRLPFKTALDPIPHKFAFIPRFIPDRLGVLINRDEVRTPMQWDGNMNAGFSSAEKTWLPVHGNYTAINVENEDGDKTSLLNVVRTLGKIRKEEAVMREGSLELMDGLPNGVLGYVRRLGNQKISILLNFTEQAREVPIEHSECIFKLSGGDDAKEKAIRLNGLGGVILKM